MYYRKYLPYPYYRRYYNINPYFYRRYYYPYYNFFDSQYSNIDQGIVNYGDMTDVYQDANVYQSMSSKPKAEHKEEKPKPVIVAHKVSAEIKPVEIVQEQHPTDDID